MGRIRPRVECRKSLLDGRAGVGRWLAAARVPIARLIAFSAVVICTLPLPPALAQELGSGRLLIAGARLTVSPESQTVPLSTPTIVATALSGWSPAAGTLPQELRVVGELSGPEIAGYLTLTALPGEPFRIPRLALEGEYRLENIRLVQGAELLSYAAPRDVAILVTQVLVTRVSSRPLTLDEVRSYGVVLGDDNFRAFNFTFGFAVDGEVIDYNLPVLYNALAPGDTLTILGQSAPQFGASSGTTSPRFKPPQMAPFTLQLDRPGGSGPVAAGGCQSGGCSVEEAVSLPGVILFPSEVSLLNQFFSVVLVAKNDAPAGDPLVIRDLAARVILPPGLRMARTEPPTPLGVPVPVRVPGADGILGTGDDLTFLVAQAEGQAEVLVEGRQQGSHVVEFQLEGILEGLPGGVERVSGLARGAVVVRDPTLAMTVTHPDVVRNDEEYTLSVTLTNTSNAPVNLVSVSLPPGGLSGVELLSSGQQTVPALLPGDSEVVEFQLRSLRTGRVVASSVKSGSAVDPSFELVVGVGDAGIPLSPDALLLPRSVEALPAPVQRHALGLLGLGFSLSTAPEPVTGSGLPRLSREQIDEKAYWLAQAGRHVRLGEDPFDSLAVAAAEWAGARDADWEWDSLRRITRRGGLWADALAQTFAAEAAATSGRTVFGRFAATTAFLGPLGGAVAEGTGARLEIASRTTGQRLRGEGIDPSRVRDLPFADLYGLAAGGEMALLAVFEDGGYQVRLTAAPGGTAGGLTLWVPDAAGGGSRLIDFAGVALPAGGLAVVDFARADTLYTLYVDRDGDGVVDEEIPGAVSTLAPRPFTAVAAVQNAQEDPSGHIVDVLLTQDLDLASLLPLDPGRFTLPGKVSNGGLVPVEEDIANFFEIVAENPFEGLRNSRIVRVIFDNPLSPYLAHDLTIRDLDSVAGAALSNVTLPVTTTVTEPGTLVEGTVFGPDGQPVPFARVELYEVDFFYHFPTPCRRHKTAAVRADSAGRYVFDYVRQTRCSDVFTLLGADPVSGHRGDARGRMRFAGGSQQLDILMLGRGTLRGHVTYEDGSVPESLRVTAYSPVFYEGREARVFADGRYEVGDVPVGTVSLAATDREGSFVYQTVELPTAGSVVERDLVIIRRSPEESTGDVRGTVVETDGVTAVFDAYVALYVDGELAGVEHSGLDGGFDFGTVPAGRAEIEAFDGETGLLGAQIFFDIAADQVNDVTVLLSDERGAVEGSVYRQELSGQVPVAGAVVWVSGTPFSAVTDAAGFYRLDGVFAGQRTLLAADLERQVQTSAAVTVNGGGAVTYRDLIFPGETIGSGISGEVVGFTGNPVPGALVHIATGGGQWWHQASTDTLGRFTLPDLAPGTYDLHAVAGTAGAAKTVTIRFQGETPFVRLQFKKGTIRGTVRFADASGQQVGVQSLVTYRTSVVQAGLVGLDWEPHTLETAADGSFEIPDALVGPYSLHVSNPFHGERRVNGELVFHGEVAEHDILFQQNGTIRARVLDWDGETPVAGARVDLQHPAFALYDLISDADGRVSFELVPPVGGRFPIEAEITSGTVFRRARVWVRFGRFGEELDVEIVLPRQGTVSGFVEDAGGSPVPGSVVTLREHAFPGRLLTQNADGEGSYRFTNVFAGTVSLAAKAPSLGGLGSKATVQLTAEGDEVFTLLRLEATGEIVGRVLSPVTGEPVPSVQVSLYRYGGGLFDSVTAGPDGAFRFRLLPLSQYRVWVFDPATGRHGEREGAWVEFNNHVREADVTLEVRGAVDGHLTDPGSAAGVPGATIRASVGSLVPFVTYSSTDVDGYFELLGIPESTFWLDTREPQGRRRASGTGSISVEGERVTVDLVLEASGGVTGTVLAPAGTAGGPFASVNTLIYQDGQVVGATLDNPFTFSGLIAGRTFVIEAHEVGGGHRGEASGRITAEGEVVTVDVTMRPIGEAEVTVRDSFGALVAGADVGLRSSGYYRQGIFSASTGPAGTALFQGVGEGHLSTWANNPATGLGGSAQGALTLEGERVALEVELADSGTVTGRVLLSDGTTPADEALVVLTLAGRTLQTFAAADGTFRFDAAPLGSFTVFAQERFGPGTARAAGALAANGELVDVGTLVMDDADPFVVELSPALYAVDQPLATAVTVRFSEPVDTTRFSTSWVAFRKLSGASVGYTVSWTEGDATLVLTPTSPLASHTGYQVTVQDAYDPAGRRLSDTARTIFTTVDIIPPTVIDVLPRDGQNQIASEAQIRLAFSEPVVPASLNGASLQLTDVTVGAGVATTWLLLPGDREALVTPVGGLATDREYRLTVQGLQDGSGNVMTAPVTTTFWTLDTTPPDISDVTFPAGTSFIAGADVPVEVTVSDVWGVASVTLSLSGWTFLDTAEPFALTGLAPVVTVAESVTVTIEAVDPFGNLASTTRTIDVAPRINASAPVVTIGCGRDGDVVVPGFDAELSFSALDDEAVESFRFLVDGVEQELVTPVNDPAPAQTFLWTPPTAPAGTLFVARLEARDFAGNVGFEEIVLEVAGGTVLVGARSLFDDYPGQDLTLVGGEFIAREPLQLNSLRVIRGSSIITADGGDLDVGAAAIYLQCGATLRAVGGSAIRLATSGATEVAERAAIVASSSGYGSAVQGDLATAAPSWVPGSGSWSGGSHGGSGSGISPGEVYNSVYRPRLAGAAGGTGVFGGGDGGGRIRLQAASLRLDGDVVAAGAPACRAGSGAGGSVEVVATALFGTGRIDVHGGDDAYCFYDTTPAGGGRVAVWVDDLTGFDVRSQLVARGGTRGQESSFAGAGSVFVRSGVSTYGDLIVDNGETSAGENRPGPPTYLPALGAGGVSSWATAGADVWVTSSEAFRARWLGAWMVILDATGAELGEFQIAELSQAGAARLSGAAGLTGAVTYRGEYRFDRIEVRRGSAVVASDPVRAAEVLLDGGGTLSGPIDSQDLTLSAGEVVFDGPVRTGNLRLQAGAVVRPGPDGVVDVVADQSLVIEAGARIDAGGRGFGGSSAPPWVAPSAGWGGGSHGGFGAGVDAGEVFDSVYRPHLGGGGGGPGVYGGGAGGGRVRLQAPSVVLDGEVLAHGAVACRGGSGSGGSVEILTGSLSGAGRVDVHGGDDAYCFYDTTPGGGGRVAVWADDLTGFDPRTQLVARGGTKGQEASFAGSGSAFVHSSTSVYGDLIVDNGETSVGANRPGPATELPALGQGVLSSWLVEGGDVWVTASGAFRARWLGTWMVVLDATGSVLGAFQVGELEASGAARLLGAASIGSAASYRGEYRFDRVQVRRGSALVATDAVQATEVVLDGGGTLSGPVVSADLTIRAGEAVFDGTVQTNDLRLESGAVVRAGADGLVHVVATGSIVVEAGARIDVTGRGYAGGHWTHYDGFGPAEVDPSTAGAGGSHGGAGRSGGAGEIYDSVYFPRLGGGGGSYREIPAVAGGGRILLEAPSVVLDGELRARGTDGCGGGGGAGGTVEVRSGSFVGLGTIDASGGDERPFSACSRGSYPGGGGRVALFVDTLAGFDARSQVSVRGGAHRDGWPVALPGTVFVQTAADAIGSLIVDPGYSPGSGLGTGRLPSIGRGLVGVATPDGAQPADLWIEPADPAQRFGWGVVGMWVRVSGVDYRVLAEDPGRRLLLLEGAAAAVATGDRFVGLYKFDSVVVGGDAKLLLDDGAEVGSLTVDPSSSFLAADADPPVITITAPTEGAFYPSGQSIAVSATVDDLSAIAEVAFTLEGQSFIDTAAPWEWSVPAPAVAQERDAVIEVEALDAAGNAGTAVRTVRVQPIASGVPPVVAIACPSAGALLAPGTGLDLSVAATHEEGIDRVELFVDGASQPAATDFVAPYSLRLDAPAGAAGGQTLLATVRATSFAGTTAETTLGVPLIAGAVFTSDAFLAASDTSLDGGAVIVAAGTLTVEGPHTFTDLVVLDGAAVTHPASPGLGASERLELSLSGDLFVSCGGAIDAGGRGLPLSAEKGIYGQDHFPTSASLSNWQVVDEGTYQGPSNWIFDNGHLRQTSNINQPGGTAGTYALWKQELPASDYRLSLRMNSVDDDFIGVMFRYVDENNYYRFRWAKQTPAMWLERIENGQVYELATDAVPYISSHWYLVEVAAAGSSLEVAIDGEVVLSATDSTHASGPVALFCSGNMNSYFDDVQVTSLDDGSEAVEHFASSAWSQQWELVDEPGALQGPSNWFRDGSYHYLKQTSNIYRNPGGFGTYARWLGPVPGPDYRVGVTLVSGDNDHIGLHFRQRDEDDYYRFRWYQESGGAQVLEKIESGQITELARLAQPYVLWRWHRVEIEVSGPQIAVWVDGELTLTAADTAHPEGGVALYSGGNNQSYYDDFRISAPLRSVVAGGSHGGRGGSFLGGSAAHGTLFDPGDPGSSGGGPFAAAGGGVVRIFALGTAVVDGAVRAPGASSPGRGPAGAGGSIRLDASAVTGSGSLVADGGDGVGQHAAGSGGRIAIYAGSWDAGLADRLSAAGGIGSTDEKTGAAGTVHLKLDGQPLGDLLLDNRGRATTQLTELPALLPGVVGAVTASSISDPAASFPDTLFGAEVYFNGNTGSLWTVLANDGQTLTLDTGQGPVSAQPGDTYEGLYRFDDVTVRGGALGICRNPVWTTSAAQVEAGSEWLPGYQPSLSITQPLAGASFTSGDPLTVNVALTDRLGVQSVRYDLAGLEQVTSVPPYSWTLTVPTVVQAGTYPLTVEVENLSGQPTVASIDVEIQP